MTVDVTPVLPEAAPRTPTGPVPDLMDVFQLAEYLGIQPEWARVLIRRDEIRHTRIGAGRRARYRIRKEWADAFLDKRAAGAEPPPPPTRRRRKAGGQP